MRGGGLCRHIMESGRLGRGAFGSSEDPSSEPAFPRKPGAVLSQRAGFVTETIDHASPDWLAAIQSPPPDVVLIDLRLPRRMAVKSRPGYSPTRH